MGRWRVAMTAQTPAERKAAERERRKEAGLTRLELYVHPEDHEAIKALAEKLQRRRARAIKTQRSKDVA
jgi:hypothetical protein